MTVYEFKMRTKLISSFFKEYLNNFDYNYSTVSGNVYLNDWVERSCYPGSLFCERAWKFILLQVTKLTKD